MAATIVTFQNRFPEFFNIEDTRVQLFLDDAALVMSDEGKWLGLFDTAHAYLAAHYLVVGEATELGDSGAFAPIKHQEVDDVVIKSAIGDVSPTLEDVYSTSYGKRYASYRRKIFNGIIGV